MAESYLKDLKKQLPCAVYLNGEYGTKDIYAGVPVIIGSKGVEKVIELDLSTEEKNNFDNSIKAVKELFDAAIKIDPELNRWDLIKWKFFTNLALFFYFSADNNGIYETKFKNFK